MVYNFFKKIQNYAKSFLSIHYNPKEIIKDFTKLSKTSSNINNYLNDFKSSISLKYKQLDNSTSKRILCLGDCMLDEFIYGTSTRLSPEAPVPVFHEANKKVTLGGAANVAANLSAYGCEIDFVSIVGNDQAGETVKDLLKKTARITPYLLKETNRITTVKRRFIAGGQQLLRVDTEQTEAISKDTQKQLIDLLPKLLDKCDVILLSDYAKGLFTPLLTQHIINEARSRGKLVIVDPKGTDYRKYNGASVIAPNKAELKMATNLPVGSDAEIIQAARKLKDQHNISSVLVTRSDEGMSLITKESEFHIKTEAQHVYDVSGAGDTVVSTLAIALACEIDLKSACEIANTAAGIVVGKSGTAVVYLDELYQKLRNKYEKQLPEKLVTLTDAKEIIVRWRAEGKVIGFTNGCFDILHPGHMMLLKSAKQLCDVLIVGLNSDASVKQLKGEQRPIQNELARATMLSSLSDTNMVIIFNELTPQNLIQMIKPDVLIKGSDYTIDQVVGADFVLANNGRVELVDLVPNFSTTNIIKKLAS